MTKFDFGPIGMSAGGLAGFFVSFKGLPLVGASDWPIFWLTTLATILVVVGGAVGYKLTANPRPYEKSA